MRGSCARLVGSSVDSVGADDGFDAAVVVDALGSCDMSAALAAGASLAGGSFVDGGCVDYYDGADQLPAV